MSKQDCKVFIGGLSWETTDQKLRAYFENHGTVLEAFVSYDRNTGRPRGFGFVVFESAEVADKVVATKHTIDRREVEAKKAVPKEENQTEKPVGSENVSQRSRKIFVGGLAPSVDESILKEYFEQFGIVEDAVVMYDHDNKRPRGFGFITFTSIEAVDKVFSVGPMQSLHDKHMEIKPAVPRDEMPSMRRSMPVQGARMGGGGYTPRGLPYPYRQTYHQGGLGYGRGFGVAGPSGRQVMSGSMQQPAVNYRAAVAATQGRAAAAVAAAAAAAAAGTNVTGQYGSNIFPQGMSTDYYAHFPMTGDNSKYSGFPGTYTGQGLGAISPETSNISSHGLVAQQDPSMYSFGGLQQSGNGYGSSLGGVGGKLGGLADVKGFPELGGNMAGSSFAAFPPNQPGSFNTVQPQPQPLYQGESSNFLTGESAFTDTVGLTSSSALQSNPEYGSFRESNFSTENNPRWPS